MCESLLRHGNHVFNCSLENDYSDEAKRDNSRSLQGDETPVRLFLSAAS